MNDYKELIECLKIRSEYNRDGGFWNEAVANDIDRAIDAIEQLVKERDAAIADLKESADCQFCKFYDAEEVDCIAKNCRCGEEWEWRGVQK